MNTNDEDKIAHIFGKHYGEEDGFEIQRCIKAILLDRDSAYEDRLSNVLKRNGWSDQHAQEFVYILKRM